MKLKQSNHAIVGRRCWTGVGRTGKEVQNTDRHKHWPRRQRVQMPTVGQESYLEKGRHGE
jgi:hypothetical protein